jgi:hypothetical protein
MLTKPPNSVAKRISKSFEPLISLTRFGLIGWSWEHKGVCPYK